MSLHIDHFNREVVVLRGMLKDVPRVLWQIEQANPEFEWTDEFLKKLSEIAGWKVAPTVHDAVALARNPTTDMMKRFHPLYPDVGKNLETEALVMSLHIDHFNREVVVLRGMLKDVPRVLWQIEQANPEFEWTDEFLKKLSEIAGWKVAPTVHDAVALARNPTTDMMKRFHPLYPDVGIPGDGADSMPQASTSSPRSDR
ncbi:hypothetical protein K435DRAFT_799006 [Dendrothele bispora CBS 962.96]|uniref:Uncharacterized protein n=1 Tax=Dendrothele bispora (strain CBS 962.96) TaxID=1314807 RepID=A0A4S8LYL5_DENBC|nr:hypothetical protein K435DRAFT_799006 [Dendrothele bispora CBS 962.96]